MHNGTTRTQPAADIEQTYWLRVTTNGCATHTEGRKARRPPLAVTSRPDKVCPPCEKSHILHKQTRLWHVFL